MTAFDLYYKHKALRDFILAALNNNLRRAFDKATYHNDVVTIYFKHQAGKFEFDLAKEQILQNLRLVYKQNYKALKAQNIAPKSFVAKTISEEILKARENRLTYPKTSTQPPLLSKATSNFKNLATTPWIREYFERVRETIKQRESNEKK